MDEGGMTLDPGLFLPEPEPAPIHCTLISVDDHLVEPAHKFEGRLPADLQPDAPSIVETPEGHQVWEFEGQLSTRVGTNSGSRTPPGYGQDRTIQVRAHATRLLRPEGPDRRHGSHRHVGFDELSISDHWFLRASLFCREEPRPDLGLACIKAWNAFPDGICLDQEGAVWFVDPVGYRVVRVQRGGAVTDSIEFVNEMTVACVLGG